MCRFSFSLALVRRELRHAGSDRPGQHRTPPIIGRLIPAGTGATDYQTLQPNLPGAATVESLGWEFPTREREWTAEQAKSWLQGGGDGEIDFGDDLALEEEVEEEV